MYLLLSYTTAALLAASSIPHVLSQSLRPSLDPFYQVPSNIESYANGAVVANRVRQVETIVGTNATQVFYKTTGLKENADGTVATIWAPSKPVSPAKIVSYQSAEDATQIDCALSYAVVKGSGSNGTTEAIALEANVVVPWALSQGYYVVLPDAEGSRSAWLVGDIEGHAALDAIRATINHFSLGSDASVGLYGYSGGAHTSVWASTLAGAYAPELNIVGAAFGGTPVDTSSTYALLNGSDESILAGGALIGLANGYPSLNSYFTKTFTAAGKAFQNTAHSSGYCLNNEANDLKNENVTSLFFGPNLNPFAHGTPLARVFARESLLTNVNPQPVPVPKFPRLEYHGTTDALTSYPAAKLYVQQQCQCGASIAFNTFTGLGHAPTAIGGLLGALQFVGQALQGTLPQYTCGTAIPRVQLNSSEAVTLFGEAVVDELRQVYASIT